MNNNNDLKSKTIIYLVIFLLLSAEIYPSILKQLLHFKILLGNFDVIRLVLTIILVVLLFIGFNWCRILIGILSFISVILSIFIISTSVYKNIYLDKFINYFTLLINTTIYLFVTIILLFSNHYKRYLNQKK